MNCINYDDLSSAITEDYNENEIYFERSKNNITCRISLKLKNDSNLCKNCKKYLLDWRLENEAYQNSYPILKDIYNLLLKSLHKLFRQCVKGCNPSQLCFSSITGPSNLVSTEIKNKERYNRTKEIIQLKEDLKTLIEKNEKLRTENNVKFLKEEIQKSFNEKIDLMKIVSKLKEEIKVLKENIQILDEIVENNMKEKQILIAQKNKQKVLLQTKDSKLGALQGAIKNKVEKFNKLKGDYDELFEKYKDEVESKYELQRKKQLNEVEWFKNKKKSMFYNNTNNIAINSDSITKYSAEKIKLNCDCIMEAKENTEALDTKSNFETKETKATLETKQTKETKENLLVINEETDNNIIQLKSSLHNNTPKLGYLNSINIGNIDNIEEVKDNYNIEKVQDNYNIDLLISSDPNKLSPSKSQAHFVRISQISKISPYNSTNSIESIEFSPEKNISKNPTQPILSINSSNTNSIQKPRNTLLNFKTGMKNIFEIPDIKNRNKNRKFSSFNINPKSDEDDSLIFLNNTGDNITFEKEKVINNEDSILCMTIIKLDDKFIIVTGGKTSIKLWDLISNHLVLTISSKDLNRSNDDVNDEFKVNCLISFISLNQQTVLVSGSADTTVNLWNPLNGELLFSFTEHTGEIYCINIFELNKEGKQTLIATGSGDNTIKIWNPESGECYMCLIGHEEWINCLANITINNQVIIASGSEDHTIKIWNLDDLNNYKTLTGHGDSVICMVAYFLNDKPYIASGSEDSTIKIWDLDDKQLVFTLTNHKNWINCLSFFENEGKHHLVSGSTDKTIKIWNAEAGTLIMSLTENESTIVCLTTIKNGDSTYIVSGSLDNKIKIWKEAK